MFIYTSLFLASLVSLLVARMVYTTISSGFKTVSKSGKPVYRSNGRKVITDSTPGYQKNGNVRKAFTDALIPLDRACNATVWDLARTQPYTAQNHQNQNAAWLVREKKLASVGEVYKVRRRVAPKPLTLDLVSKPWRREVAPWIQNPEFVREDF